MIHSQRNRHKTLKKGNAETTWISSIAGFVLLAVAGFYFYSGAPHISSIPSSPALVIGTPLHELKFDDRSSLQIFAIGDGQVIDGTTSTSTKTTIFSTQASGSHTSGMSGNGVQCTIKIFTINEQITCLQFNSPPANLVIETRLLDPSNKPLTSSRILWGNEVRKGGGNDHNFLGWDALIAAAAKEETMPELVVQLSDGAGGWIDGCGPFDSDDDHDHRAMVSFAAWPRSSVDLEFRAAQPGMKPVTWKMKNPTPPTKPAAWTAIPFPQKESNSDFELELKSALKIEGTRMIQPEFEFRSTIPGSQIPTGANFKEPALACDCTELLGAWGTRTEKAYLKLPDNYVIGGFPYPPDERLLRFHFVVSPTDYYPYPRTGSLLIAQMKVAANGISLESTPHILTDIGILSVDFNDVKCGEDGSFRYTVKGRWNNRAEEAKGEAALNRDRGIPVCFVGEGNVSTGKTHTNGDSTSGRNDITEFEFEGEWKGNLQPGDEVTFGMTTPLPKRDVFFTFER